MRTLKIVLIPIIVLFSSCNNYWHCPTKKTSTSNYNHCLIRKAERIVDSYNKKDYFRFVHLFPNSFTDLEALYGYDTKPCILYASSSTHIEYLFKECPNTFKHQLLKKAYHIAIQGKWDADAVNYFQDNLIDFIVNNPKEVASLLKTKPKEQIDRFWFFIFDGSTEGDLQIRDIFEEVYTKINQVDVKQGELLVKKFKEMYN